jgi:hypothetical protein
MVMREDFDPANIEAQDLPPMDQWDVVSDPFERPKVYRHKVPLIKSPNGSNGVYLFVVEKRGVAPIALHDMGEDIVPPELRFLVENEPVEIGTVGKIPKRNAENYLNLAGEGNEWTLHRHAMLNLNKVPKSATSIPFRLKSPEPSNPPGAPVPKGPNYSLFITAAPMATVRGVIEGPALLGLR